MKQKLRILNLEDSETDAELIQAKLEEEGIVCELTRVETERDFVAAISRGDFDLLLVDYKLPSFDGMSALAIAREKCAEIPFIFVSGSIGEDTAIEALKNGATDYVLKDKLSRLAPAVRRALQDAAGRRERRKAEERLKLLNECFLEFGPNQLENINRLVSLCGKFMGGTCALYNRLEDERLCSWAQWNVPPDYKTVDAPEGHICFDVIKGGSDNVVVIRNLPETAYARTDPNVTRYKLQTYVGIAVKFSGAYVGSLCVVYQKDVVPDEDDKNIMGIIASGIGIEEKRRQVEQVVAAAAKEWSESFDAMADGVSIHSADNTIINVNQSLCLILGKTAKELIGSKCYQVFHGKAGPIAACPLERSKEINQKGYLEIFEPALNKWLAISTSPICDDSGCLVKVVHTVRDITEHRNLENQLRHAQKMEAVGQLAGGIAHDFNNILSAIMGYGDILQRKIAPNDPLQPNVEQILEAADRAAQLTRSLLAFSRKQAMNPNPTDMNKIIRKIEKLLLRVIGEDIELKTGLADRELAVLADSGQIEQALMNLATNARDAMPKGGLLTIDTDTRTLEDDFIHAHGYGSPGEYVVISVADTGIGMSEQTRLRIFEPFFTTKEMGKGTGLGMSIVYSIIKQHNGFINVYSEPGQGAMFRIYLPLIRDAAAEEKKPEVREYPARGTETILVAEDDATLRKLSESVLKEFGYTVILAEDGAEAVRKFSENKDLIQLCMLDMIMPKKNGKEAYNEIKKIEPDIKALFVSGYTADIMLTKGIVEEGLEFIMKPLSPMDLLRKVREILDRD